VTFPPHHQGIPLGARRTDSKILRARLQLAHLPFVKNFEQFDFSFQPSIDERQIRELRSLRFIHEASNVFLGPPGVGKTHLSVALAEAAIRAGLGAYFITAHDLATDLGEPIAKADWIAGCGSIWRRKFW
jgi:DNA replication protein DnaC